MSIKVENLCLSYDGTDVVKNLDLFIPKGSICTIIGPNGCGKSTLLKAISRNLPIKSGIVEIYGKNIHNYNNKVLSRKMAFLTQEPHIPYQFSVKELVSHGRYPYLNWLGLLKSKDHEIIRDSIESTGLSDLETRNVSSLSGGERQRVWIAMALAQEAEIFILDEPTTYLDLAHQLQILQLINRLNKDFKKTILMVLHDLNQAARFSHYIFALKRGRLICSGSPDEVIKEKVIQDIFSIESRILRDLDNDCPYIIPQKSTEREAVYL